MFSSFIPPFLQIFLWLSEISRAVFPAFPDFCLQFELEVIYGPDLCAEGAS